MEKNQMKNLFDAAKKASEKAYVPYSHFPVGAAVLLENGEVVSGCNIENRSYGLTNCGERTAIFRALAEGKMKFTAIAIATPASDYPVGPCGACRQVISEFFPSDAPVLFGHTFEESILSSVKEIYPFDSLHELKK